MTDKAQDILGMILFTYGILAIIGAFVLMIWF